MATSHTFSIGIQVRKGRIDVDRKAVDAALKAWPDCEATLTIDAEGAKRSNAANRYLFGIIYRDIHEETKQPVEDIHNEMCARFTTKTLHYTLPKTGEVIELEVVTRTSGMSVGQFHRFVEKVKLFSQEFFGLTFEDAPDEYHKERARADAREAKKGAAA